MSRLSRIGVLPAIKMYKTIAIDTETYSSFNKKEYFNAKYQELIDNNINPTVARGNKINKDADKLQKFHALDTLTNKVRLLQLKLEDGQTFVIDTMTEMPLFLEILQELSNHILIGHNLKFDLKSLYKYDKSILKARVVDTMLLQKLYTNQEFSERQKAGLKDTLKMHMNIEMSKEEQNSDWSEFKLSKEQIEYAKADVQHLHKLANILLAKLDNKNIAKMEMELLPIIAEIEINGINVNQRGMIDRADLMLEEWEDLEAQLKVVKLNPRSPKQIKEWCHNEGFYVKDSSAKTLKKQASKCPMIPEVLKAKKLGKEIKAINGYVEDVSEIDNRLHANFNQLGAVSGRMSSSKPNVQQIPRPIKDLFYTVTEDNIIIKIDYSAVELRIASIVMRVKPMVEALNNGEDLHQKTASLIYNVPMEEVKKEQRQTAKAVNFGLLFGMSAPTLMEYAEGFGVELTLKEANKFKNKYMRAYPEIKRFHDLNSRKIEEQGSFKTRTLAGRLGKVNRFTNANNYPVQGTGADLLKMSVINYHKANTTGAKMISLVHDEIIIEVARKHEKLAIEELSKAMIDSCLTLGIDYPNPVGVEVLK